MRAVPGSRSSVCPVLVAVSLALSPARVEGSEAGLSLEGMLGVGYDSNYALLGTARNLPLPHAASDDVSAGLWTFGAEASAWAGPHPVIAIALEPSIEVRHFFDNEYVLEPGADLRIAFFPQDVLEIDLGAGYRYHRFSYFGEYSFHEPHAWIDLVLTPGSHTLVAGYAFAFRRLPADTDMQETEHACRLGWHIVLADVVGIGLHFEYARVRGSEPWMGLDILNGVVGIDFEWRILDAGVGYGPGVLWIESGGVGLVNRVTARAGVTWPKWIRLGVDYSFEKLDALHSVARDVPYDRHVFLFTATASWEVSTGEGVEPELDAVETREGIEIFHDAVSFRVLAPDARTVTLVGSFNGWQEPGEELEGPDGEGMWTLEVDLPPGRYEVVYVVDGEVVLPPGAPAIVEDGLGGRSAVIFVP